MVVNSAFCPVLTSFVLMQADSAFWTRKPQAAIPVKKPKAKTHAPGHRKKQTVEDLLKLDDSEVEIDSLGRLFVQLMDADSS